MKINIEDYKRSWFKNYKDIEYLQYDLLIKGSLSKEQENVMKNLAKDIYEYNNRGNLSDK